MGSDWFAKVQTTGRTHTGRPVLLMEFEKENGGSVYCSNSMKIDTHVMSTKQFGDRGEQVAADYLERKGYRIIDRNYRFERAELDLIAFSPGERGEYGSELVFVEVKTRSGVAFGRPEEAVSGAKRRHIVRAAQAYLHEQRLEKARCRFDVVSVLLRGKEEPQIKHFERAFWAY